MREPIFMILHSNKNFEIWLWGSRCIPTLEGEFPSRKRDTLLKLLLILLVNPRPDGEAHGQVLQENVIRASLRDIEKYPVLTSIYLLWEVRMIINEIFIHCFYWKVLKNNNCN